MNNSVKVRLYPRLPQNLQAFAPWQQKTGPSKPAKARVHFAPAKQLTAALLVGQMVGWYDTTRADVVSDRTSGLSKSN